MKMVIVPDIHNGYARAEAIINVEKPDYTIFLGDYFDSFGDSWEDTNNTAYWLKHSVERKDRTHLIGNHDLGYMTDNPQLKYCSGYNDLKHLIIKKHNIDWSKLVLFAWAGDWLVTHAGLSKTYYDTMNKAKEVTDTVSLEFNNELANIDNQNVEHRLFEAGMARGGREKCGGILWCDYDEFVDIPGVKQIFGHTKDPEVRHGNSENAEHYCIDTGLKHYGVYDTKNNLMTIAEAKNY